MSSRTAGAATATVLITLAGCSFSTGTAVDAAAEALIESELAEQSGLVYVDAVCAKPGSDEVGETFTCTATTDDGGAAEFVGIIDPDEQIFVAPSNLIAISDMPIVEAQAAETLGESIGVSIDPLAVDCPDVSTLLVDDELFCEITDEATGDRFVMIMTATDFVLREGFGSLNFRIGDPID